MKVEVNCPVCGANLSVEVQKNQIPNKAEDRIKALEAAGVDVSGLFAIRGSSGAELIVRMVNGIPHPVADDDPVFAAILKAGTIPDRRLFRRWVMAQMFRMMEPTHYCSGYTDAMHRKGYEYTWDMVVEEFRVQAKLAQRDKENYAKRNCWFNKEVALEMSKDYLSKLTLWFDNLKEKHCHGVPYKTVKGLNVFVEDFDKKYIRPLAHLRLKIDKAKTAQELYKAVADFNRARVKLPWDIKQSDAWCDAYKGSGAYFTLENLILFHGVTLRKPNGRFLSKLESLNLLYAMAREYSSTGRDGWRMLACLRKAIADNKIDIAAKRAEWAAQKRAKLGR